MISTKSDGEVYACLDPRGRTPGRAKVPLTAPRPASLEGKSVLVVTREDFPSLITELQDLLRKQVPGVDVTIWDIGRQGLINDAQAKQLEVDVALAGGDCD